MPYLHTDNIAELVKATGIPNEDFFDYTFSDPYQVVEQYFQFCQTNLSEKCDEYNIQPAKFYIRKRMDVNAAAAKVQDYYLIRVNFGTIVTMFRMYTDHRSIFESEALSDFVELHNKLDASLDYLLFQISIQFTFYHERAHLIQKSPVDNTWIEESYENLIPENEPFDLQRHLYEFDADLHGATFVAFHLVEYWKKQTDDLKTDKHLNLIVSVGVAGVLAYFIFMKRNYSKVYYKASTHPHPLIRISYILDNLVRTVEGNLDQKLAFNSTGIIKDAFRIVDNLFTAAGTTWLSEFTNDFFDEMKDIKSYVDSVLIAESKKLPELTINR